MIQTFKTMFLFSMMNAIFLIVGYMIADTSGLLVALFFGFITNFFLYYFSENLVIRVYGAIPLSEYSYPEVHEIVEELSRTARIQKPKLWICNINVANAFATGRGPSNSSIVLTPQIIRILNKDELRAVIAHEISHITNRDILISTIVAVVASAISFFPDILRYQLYWGNNDSKSNSNKSGQMKLVFYLFIIICVPLVTLLLRLAISRAREFQADETGAKLSHSPLDLASALKKLEQYSATGDLYMDDKEAGLRSHMAQGFFVNPFRPSIGSWIGNLFSSHPSTKDRVNRLEKMRI